MTLQHYFSSGAKLVNRALKIPACVELMLKLEEKQTVNKIKNGYCYT